MPKLKIAVLGSTGSIGRQTLDVLTGLKATHELDFIANNSDFLGLSAQCAAFMPRRAFLSSKNQWIEKKESQSRLGDALADPETYKNVDIVVNGIAGLAGIAPSIAVLEAGKTLATANKESLVCYGLHLKALEKRFGGRILPVDSEHSALFQCLEEKHDFEQLTVTASGGAFRDVLKNNLHKVKAADALKHPNWVMGSKVTVDCATMVNKAFELIEAARLFETQNVDAILHRESIVHALVTYRDGSVKASLGMPDMRIPIQFALTYPKRETCLAKKLDLSVLESLTFNKIDEERYPAYALLKDFVKKGEYEGTLAVSADEVLVKLYLENKIGYFDFAEIFDKVFARFRGGTLNGALDIFSISRDVEAYICSILPKEGA